MTELPPSTGFGSTTDQVCVPISSTLVTIMSSVEAAATTIRVAYPRADAVLSVALDKAERYVQATLDNGCADRGSCAADQPAVGLTVNGNDLRFVLAGEIVSNEQLAVELLTKLTRGTSEGEQS